MAAYRNAGTVPDTLDESRATGQDARSARAVDGRRANLFEAFRSLDVGFGQKVAFRRTRDWYRLAAKAPRRSGE